MKKKVTRFFSKIAAAQAEGIGVIEIILILVIIIGLVIIFREQIQAIIQSAFDSINANTETINNTEITVK